MVRSEGAAGGHPQSGCRFHISTGALPQSRQGSDQPKEDEAAGGHAQGHSEVARDEKGNIVDMQEKSCSELESRWIAGRGSNASPIMDGGCG